MDESDTIALCGLDGNQNEPPTRHEINTLVRRVNIGHLRPVKQTLSEIKAKVIQHCDECDAFRNQLRGARIALWLVVGALLSIIPLGIKILEALKILLATKP